MSGKRLKNGRMRIGMNKHGDATGESLFINCATQQPQGDVRYSMQWGRLFTHIIQFHAGWMQTA